MLSFLVWLINYSLGPLLWTVNVPSEWLFRGTVLNQYNVLFSCCRKRKRGFSLTWKWQVGRSSNEAWLLSHVATHSHNILINFFVRKLRCLGESTCDMHVHMCMCMSVTAPVLLHSHRKGSNQRSWITLSMLDVLGHGDVAGNRICVWGLTKGDKVQLNSPSSSKLRTIQELCVASVPRRGLHRHAWLAMESTSASLERAVAWQLQLCKTGLEIRSYFWSWWEINYWNSLLGKLAGSSLLNVFEMRQLNGQDVLSGLCSSGSVSPCSGAVLSASCAFPSVWH